MNIGIIIPEIGGYSSLSIEFQKWYAIMESLGHSLFIITGRSRQVMKQMTVMADLHHESDFNMEFSSQMFQLTDDDDAEIQSLKAQSIRIQGIFRIIGQLQMLWMWWLLKIIFRFHPICRLLMRLTYFFKILIVKK